jgi:hypothetical protein
MSGRFMYTTKHLVGHTDLISLELHREHHVGDCQQRDFAWILRIVGMVAVSHTSNEKPGVAATWK